MRQLRYLSLPKLDFGYFQFWKKQCRKETSHFTAIPVFRFLNYVMLNSFTLIDSVIVVRREHTDERLATGKRLGDLDQEMPNRRLLVL